MSRPRSWSSTMRRRASALSSGGIGEPARVGRRLDPEVGERERREVDDAARLGVDPDREDRDLGVARLERAVAAAAKVAATGEIGELDPERRRDEQLARIRVRERGPGALESIRVVQQGSVAPRVPTVVRRREAELLTVAP